MAKDDFINEKIDEFWEPIQSTIKNNGDGLRYLLMMFAKEVERETRHNAVELATKLHADIMNL